MVAQAGLRDRGDELFSELAAKVELATALRLSSFDREAASTRLVTFCTERVLSHLEVTDQVLYAVAAGAAETRLLVRALRIQHRMIASEIESLRRADSGAEVMVAAAHALLTLLEECLQIEKLVLLPAIATLPGVDLTSLMEDAETLLRGGVLARPEVLDVREIPHGQRHPRIFAMYARLAPGESFVLVNNHDPKPLRREFEATYPEQFSWEYEQSGPTNWRVHIGRRPVRA
ncbi:DUF2249 domain-containing protein [Pseudonocardia sp. Cha107L01]|uniref:DUF2249 domain-containing protein n=1 Tax=Pseudonocardia sp. Cha107L01 TaxID=3457576 RepID=UPI00403E5242